MMNPLEDSREQIARAQEKQKYINWFFILSWIVILIITLLFGAFVYYQIMKFFDWLF